MFYVYILKSYKTRELYIGFTGGLRRRFLSHNSVESKNFSTKAGRPWELVYYEAYSIKRYAEERERKLKYYGKGLTMLKKRIGID